MKRPTGKDIKTYCYKSAKDCNIVETGINLLVMFVCTNCKAECSEALRDQKQKDEEPDDFSLWGIDLDGDDVSQ